MAANKDVGYKKYLTLVAVTGFIVAIDQLTKLFVHSRYLHGESTAVYPGLLNFTYVRNYGAAFGFLADSPPMFRESFFFLMPPVALLIVLLILRTVPSNDRIQIFALSAIFGGALGNYIDRLKFRYVVDFIDFNIPWGIWMSRLGIHTNTQNYSFPAFNLADMAIVSGLLTIFLLMIVEIWRSTKKSAPSNNQAS